MTQYKFCLIYNYTVRPLLSAVLGRTKFWSHKPQIIEVWIILLEVLLYFILGVPHFGLKTADNRGLTVTVVIDADAKCPRVKLNSDTCGERGEGVKIWQNLADVF